MQSRTLARAFLRWLSLGLIACATPAAAASITGVCPDGSMFIVKRMDLIPCSAAKLVEGDDVPPLRPEYLPRPYGWESFHRKRNPNNPYNLVRSKPIPDVAAPPPERYDARSLETNVPEERVATRSEFQEEPAAAPARRTAKPGLGLSERELRDLARIVELTQQHAPASIVARDADDRVRLARSAAFEARVRGQGIASEGSVVLFLAEPSEAAGFHPNFTFVQKGVAFSPSADQPSEFGVLRGTLGDGSGEPVLGYVVLPTRLDPAQPMDIYWNDRQITATLRPPR